MKNYFKNIYKQGYDQFKIIMLNNLNMKKRMFIVTANPITYMCANEDKEVNKILLDKDVTVVADGIGVIKACKKLGFKINSRITGIDLSYELLNEANKNKLSVFFFGATEYVRKKLISKIKIEYPNIIICGSENGFVKDKNKTFEKIKKLEPDIVLVAMGIPMQEKLIYNHYKEFNKGIFMGVGGSFDVISGVKRRAPQVFIKINMEWLYRLIKEPYRIKNFYKNNVKFLFNVKKK